MTVKFESLLPQESKFANGIGETVFALKGSTLQFSSIVQDEKDKREMADEQVSIESTCTSSIAPVERILFSSQSYQN